ncbi:STAS domain-containing protein [Catellatospora sp. NPDC049609]|uniref:STAS domain-containing protein n=1 Tax=Catellatospora sp. NPDC049609 TaxID=3155505 RepID=UPI0034346185
MPSQLNHRIEYDSSVVRVCLSGEIDLAVVEQLHELLTSSSRQQPGLPLRVDMGGVTFIDSSGIRAFVHARDRVAAGGGELLLVNVAGMAMRVLQVTGVYGYLCETR